MTADDTHKRLSPFAPRDHFLPWSQVMPRTLWSRVLLSSCGCLATICILLHYLGWQNALYWYGGPYLIVNAWLVTYTWLQHTHPDVPHYGTGAHSFLRGALCTIDRPYPLLIDALHHHIGTTHVAHHMSHTVPHYHAQECTLELKRILGSRYKFDSTPILCALWRVSGECLFVVSQLYQDNVVKYAS